MRKLLFFIFACFSLASHAQTQVDLQKTYIIGQNVRLTICDPVGTPLTALPAAPPGFVASATFAAANARASVTTALSAGGAVNYSEIVFRGYEFKVVSQQANFVVIEMLKWTDAPDLNKLYYDPSTANTTATIFFQLPLDEFAKALVRYPRISFAVGAITMPIKLRFGGKNGDGMTTRYFNFEGSINIGLSAGAAIRLNKSKFINRDFLNILAGFSITTVPVDSATTQGHIMTSTNTSAFTWSLTTLYQRDNFQAGLFFGIDYLAGETGSKWVYKDKMWMGLGIGFSIFQSKKSTDTQN
jgi:hypothetical protein